MGWNLIYSSANYRSRALVNSFDKALKEGAMDDNRVVLVLRLGSPHLFERWSQESMRLLASHDRTLRTWALRQVPVTCIVHASDVQRLMLTLPFLLDNPAQDDLQALNNGKPQDLRVSDPHQRS